MEKIPLGVSSCLLGNSVRYDGGHKLDHYLTDILALFFDFVPVCPEVECGLPIPREAMRLIGDPEAPRLVTNKTGVDLTDRMLDYCRRKMPELESHNLCGFIFKNDSPSSGLHRVKIYHEGSPARSGRGLFADAFTRHFPLIPVEEEGRLNDPKLRENFIEKVFSYKRLKDFLASSPGLGDFVKFHTAHKLLMMSHNVVLYREMGALVAKGKSMEKSKIFNAYEELFMRTLSFQATEKKNANVLMHILGYFKKQLTSEEKEEMLNLIELYAKNLVPLVVPVTLIRHYVRKYRDPYLTSQLYLNPHPAELMLRNHV